MRSYVTKIVLPDGHELTFAPPIEFAQSEPIPAQLTLGTKVIMQIAQISWHEWPKSASDEGVFHLFISDGGDHKNVP